jgi:hypothetical protein
MTMMTRCGVLADRACLPPERDHPLMVPHLLLRASALAQGSLAQKQQMAAAKKAEEEMRKKLAKK